MSDQTLPTVDLEDAWADALEAAFAEHEDGELPEMPDRPRDTRPLADGYTKFTADRVRYIVAALRRGHPQRTAASLAGISPRTLRRWKSAGREVVEAVEGGEVKPDELGEEAALVGLFYYSLQAARGQFAYAAVERIREEGFDPDGDWRAARELLRVSQPEVFGSQKERRSLDAGEGGGDETINIAIKIDGGPPGGVEQDPEERTRLVLDEAGNIIEREGPDDAA